MKICYFCNKEAFYGSMCKKCLKEMEKELYVSNYKKKIGGKVWKLKKSL